MNFVRKQLLGISTVIADIKAWCTKTFALKSHKHTKSDITDLDTTVTLIAKGYSNGVYYRKYSDGYIEQWGILYSDIGNYTSHIMQVTLPLSFSDTGYCVTTGHGGRQHAIPYNMVRVSVISPNVINFCMSSDVLNEMVYWRACGY